MVTKEYSVQIKFKKQALFKSKQAKKTHWWVWDWWLECGSAVAFDTKLMGGIPGDTLIFWRRMIPLNCCLLGAVFLPGKCLWQQLHCLCAFITCLAEGSCAWSASLCIIAVISSAIFTKTDFFLSDAHCETDTFSQHCLPSRQAAHPLLFLIGRLRYHYSLYRKTLLLI